MHRAIRLLRRLIRPALVALLALVVVAGPAVTNPARIHASAARAFHPRFVAARCPFKVGQGLVEGKSVRCGYVVVPERWAAPRGQTIRLAVAIFKSPFIAPDPDPLVFLQGGPGGAIIGQLGPVITKANASVLVGHRDLVLLDQRGTGYSRPSLACPELTRLQYATLDQNLSLRRQDALQIRAATQCRDRLTHAGIDLNAYTTRADAGDVDALRAALDYQALHLYGVSYGTRLALEIMRLYPQDLDSVVLDSVDPPQDDNISAPLHSLLRAINVLFAGCAAERTCHKAYPHLDSTFYGLVDRLNAHPATIHTVDTTTGKRYTVLFGGDDLTDELFQALYDSQLIPLLPRMIAQAARGSYALAARIYGLVEFDDSVSLGDYYAVACGEDAPFTSRARIDALAHALPPAIRAAQRDAALATLAVCRAWDVRSVPPAERAPVDSAIPTLVLAGQYDPITPPSNGKAVARRLSRSYVFQFPGLGHGVLFSGASSCPYTIAAAFLDDPMHKPDAGCIKSMSPPTFLTR